MNIKSLFIKFFNLSFYTSKLDQFLAEFVKKHPKLSASQRREKEKYARIYQQRDHACQPPAKNVGWDNF